MGFGDKLKGLRDQAQHTVAENRDRIQGAVHTVGEAANARTHGRYADKIAKVGEKVSHGVDRAGGTAEDTGAPAGAPAGEAPVAAAPVAEAPVAAAPVAEAPVTAAPAETEPATPAAAGESPGEATQPPAGSPPEFD